MNPHRFNSATDIRRSLFDRFREDKRAFSYFIAQAIGSSAVRLLDFSFEFVLVQTLQPGFTSLDNEVRIVMTPEGEAYALLLPRVESFFVAVEIGRFLLSIDCLFEEPLPFAEEGVVARLNDSAPVLSRAVAKYGADAQSRMVFEECGELVAELARWQRGRSTVDDVAGEVADVLLVCLQMARILGDKRVEECVVRKTDRLRSKLDDEYQEAELQARTVALQEFNDAVEEHLERAAKEEAVRETVESLERLDAISTGFDVGVAMGESLRELTFFAFGVSSGLSSLQPPTDPSVPSIDPNSTPEEVDAWLARHQEAPAVRRLQSELEDLRKRIEKLEAHIDEIRPLDEDARSR